MRRNERGPAEELRDRFRRHEGVAVFRGERLVWTVDPETMKGRLVNREGDAVALNFDAGRYPWSDGPSSLLMQTGRAVDPGERARIGTEAWLTWDGSDLVVEVKRSPLGTGSLRWEGPD